MSSRIKIIGYSRKMKKALLVFGILLLSALVSAGEHHQSAIEEGKNLVESGISCDELDDEQLEAIGEYYMEQMHPGEAHEAVHEMMGIEEGTEYHKRLHVNIAQMMYCGEGGMMGMMGGNMMGRQTPIQTYMMQEMRGDQSRDLTIFDSLYIILLIGLIVLVSLVIVKLWKDVSKDKK